MLTNIAFYKFVNVEDKAKLKEELNVLCTSLELKGTVILANEGINSCLVGAEENINRFIDYMRADDRFSDIEFKKSYCEREPFRRMLVKIKREIIPMGFEYIKPAESTGKYVDPLELKSWLDNKEDVIVLDTRNDYEVEIGTFRQAINPNLGMFNQFTKWIDEQAVLNADWKKKKVVTFCTGGIRCEKASAYMQHIGFEDVYQINGGILKYFEDTNAKAPDQDNHYEGECFVFDYRVAVDQKLNATENFTVCFKCWNPLSKADLNRPEYQEKISCHHCIHKN